MNKMSFWHWLGLLIIISVVGGIVFRLAYGNKLIEAAKRNTDASQ